MLPAPVSAAPPPPAPAAVPLRPVEVVLEGLSDGRTGPVSDTAPTIAALETLAHALYALPAVPLAFRYLYKGTTPVALATDTDLQYAFNLLRARDPRPDAPAPFRVVVRAPLPPDELQAIAAAPPPPPPPPVQSTGNDEEDVKGEASTSPADEHGDEAVAPEGGSSAPATEQEEAVPDDVPEPLVDEDDIPGDAAEVREEPGVKAAPEQRPRVASVGDLVPMVDVMKLMMSDPVLSAMVERMAVRLVTQDSNKELRDALVAMARDMGGVAAPAAQEQAPVPSAAPRVPPPDAQPAQIPTSAARVPKTKTQDGVSLAERQRLQQQQQQRALRMQQLQRQRMLQQQQQRRQQQQQQAQQQQKQQEASPVQNVFNGITSFFTSLASPPAPHEAPSARAAAKAPSPTVRSIPQGPRAQSRPAPEPSPVPAAPATPAVLECQRELQKLGVHVEIPQCAALLSKYKTKEAVCSAVVTFYRKRESARNLQHHGS